MPRTYVLHIAAVPTKFDATLVVADVFISCLPDRPNCLDIAHACTCDLLWPRLTLYISAYLYRWVALPIERAAATALLHERAPNLSIQVT